MWARITNTEMVSHAEACGASGTGHVTMEHMFHNATALNSNYAFHFWDVSTVTSTESMFRGASTFNGNLFTWNTANITSTAYMFCGTKTHTQPLHTTPGLSERWV